MSNLETRALNCVLGRKWEHSPWQPMVGFRVVHQMPGGLHTPGLDHLGADIPHVSDASLEQDRRDVSVSGLRRRPPESVEMPGPLHESGLGLEPAFTAQEGIKHDLIAIEGIA